VDGVAALHVLAYLYLELFVVSAVEPAQLELAYHQENPACSRAGRSDDPGATVLSRYIRPVVISNHAILPGLGNQTWASDTVTCPTEVFYRTGSHQGRMSQYNLRAMNLDRTNGITQISHCIYADHLSRPSPAHLRSSAHKCMSSTASALSGRSEQALLLSQAAALCSSLSTSYRDSD
jgi:hypothetical protein